MASLSPFPPQTHPLCPTSLLSPKDKKGKREHLVGIGRTNGREDVEDCREVVVVMSETVLVYQFGDEETKISELEEE